MSTRLGFRPRPVDVQKQLSIVRDVNELDSTDGLVLKDGTIEEQPAEQPAVPPPKAVKKNIPVPDVRHVPTYRHDYLPVFQQHHTYIRGQGGIGWHMPEYVEYDLDSEDERWLGQRNTDGQVRLTDDKLERILWKLELNCAEATERALAGAGAAPAERCAATALAATDHMAREAALDMLKRDVGGRELLLETAFLYWKDKRMKMGKPLLRRLQPPTSASDTNPFNVFRPREKVNRPQTRRRRENNEECLDKLRSIRANLEAAKEMVDLLAKRELKKRDLVLVECSLNQLQCRLHHHPRAMAEQIEQEVWASLKQQRRAIPLDRRKEALESGRTGMKRFKADTAPLGAPDPAAVAELPPPPKRQVPVDMLFATTINVSQLNLDDASLQLPPHLDMSTCRVRIGRGGRCIIDRYNALTLKPWTQAELQDSRHLEPIPPIPVIKLPSASMGATQRRSSQAADVVNGSVGAGDGPSGRNVPAHGADTAERKVMRPATQPPPKTAASKAVPKGAPAIAGQPIKRGPGRPPKTKPPLVANGDVHLPSRPGSAMDMG